MEIQTTGPEASKAAAKAAMWASIFGTLGWTIVAVALFATCGWSPYCGPGVFFHGRDTEPTNPGTE